MIRSLFMFIAAAALTVHVSAEQFRVWNDITGLTFEARYVSVTSQNVTLENREGRRVDFYTADFMSKDKQYILAQSNPAPSAKVDAASAKAPSEIFESLEGKTTDPLNANADYLAIYFSAHWCPPCRTFTPILADFYKDHFKDGGDFDVLFVSADRSERAMKEYIRWGKMKFPALEFDEKKNARNITKYAGNGIPCLVVIDREGNVIADSYEGKKYVGVRKPLSKLESLLN